MTELKPCPLCGAPAEVIEMWPGTRAVEEGTRIDYDECDYFVRCSDEANCYKQNKACVYVSSWSREEAAAAWNRAVANKEGQR